MVWRMVVWEHPNLSHSPLVFARQVVHHLVLDRNIPAIQTTTLMHAHWFYWLFKRDSTSTPPIQNALIHVVRKMILWFYIDKNEHHSVPHVLSSRGASVLIISSAQVFSEHPNSARSDLGKTSFEANVCFWNQPVELKPISGGLNGYQVSWPWHMGVPSHRKAEPFRRALHGNYSASCQMARELSTPIFQFFQWS